MFRRQRLVATHAAVPLGPSLQDAGRTVWPHQVP
jgi:hypothetical protein